MKAGNIMQAWGGIADCKTAWDVMFDKRCKNARALVADVWYHGDQRRRRYFWLRNIKDVLPPAKMLTRL